MRNLRKICAILVFGCMLASCENDKKEEMGIDQLLIVEGYIYAGEPVKHIRLSKIHGGGIAQEVPVLDADIWIEHNEESIMLSPHDSIDGWYVQTDTTALPQNHGTLSLYVNYGGRTYTAHTEMPPAVSGLAISTDQISLQLGSEQTVLAELVWDAVYAGPYCLFIRNVAANALSTGHGGAAQSGNPFYQVVYHNHIELKGAHFSHYGTYEIYVTAVNKEYVDLFGSGTSGSMVAAPSNVSNGYGVFTAFNGQAVTVHVN